MVRFRLIRIRRRCHPGKSNGTGVGVTVGVATTGRCCSAIPDGDETGSRGGIDRGQVQDTVLCGLFRNGRGGLGRIIFRGQSRKDRGFPIGGIIGHTHIHIGVGPDTATSATTAIQMQHGHSRRSQSTTHGFIFRIFRIGTEIETTRFPIRVFTPHRDIPRRKS